MLFYSKSDDRMNELRARPRAPLDFAEPACCREGMGCGHLYENGVAARMEQHQSAGFQGLLSVAVDG